MKFSKVGIIDGRIMNTLFRIYLAVISTQLMLVVYAVKNEYHLGVFFQSVDWLQHLPHLISYGMYVSCAVLLSWIGIYMFRHLGRDEFKKGEVTSIENVSRKFLSFYVGLVLVALVVPNDNSLLSIYAVLTTLFYLSDAYYFNLLFMLFGYQCYRVNTGSGMTLFLISRECYKVPGWVEIPLVFRINNTTFIETHITDRDL